MKANELMIGDWVYMEAHRGYEAQYIQVETIPDANSKDHYGHIGAFPVGGDNDFQDIEDRHLFPIPLTPEILEKNGFTSYGEAWYLPENKTTGNEKILVGFHMYETHISVRNGSKCFDNSVPCEYRACAANRNVFVHELQRALRLCGIEKEVTL